MLVCQSCNTADATQLDSFVASASAVCIGHKIMTGRSDLQMSRLLQYTTIIFNLLSHRSLDVAHDTGRPAGHFQDRRPKLYQRHCSCIFIGDLCVPVENA